MEKWYRDLSPLFCYILQEAESNDNGRAPHSAWRNYDDFNEYFWWVDLLDEAYLSALLTPSIVIVINFIIVIDVENCYC